MTRSLELDHDNIADAKMFIDTHFSNAENTIWSNIAINVNMNGIARCGSRYQVFGERIEHAVLVLFPWSA